LQLGEDEAMTSSEQRAAIKKLILQHTKKVSASKEAAMVSLVRNGIYTKSGRLTARYGGGKKKTA
jgi:hypothetical protein